MVGSNARARAHKCVSCKQLHESLKDHESIGLDQFVWMCTLSKRKGVADKTSSTETAPVERPSHDRLASGQQSVSPPELHARVDTGRYACRRSRYRMSAGRDFSETAQPSAAFGTDDRAHQEKGSFEGEYERLLNRFGRRMRDLIEKGCRLRQPGR